MDEEKKKFVMMNTFVADVYTRSVDEEEASDSLITTVANTMLMGAYYICEHGFVTAENLSFVTSWIRICIWLVGSGRSDLYPSLPSLNESEFWEEENMLSLEYITVENLLRVFDIPFLIHCIASEEGDTRYLACRDPAARSERKRLLWALDESKEENTFKFALAFFRFVITENLILNKFHRVPIPDADPKHLDVALAFFAAAIDRKNNDNLQQWFSHMMYIYEVGIFKLLTFFGVGDRSGLTIFHRFQSVSS